MNIVAIPTTPANQCSTTALSARHQTLDDAIAKKNGYRLAFDFREDRAKQIKAAAKRELMRRAEGGDTEAVTYQNQREWQKKAQVAQSVAA